jgi:lipoyl(octanoyl) transferase
MKAGTVYKTGSLDYQAAWDLQKELHGRRYRGGIEDTLLLLEHPHTYTIGKSGGENHLLADESALARRGIMVYRIDRGGDITYHGPGQLIGYPILDLHQHYLDVHRFLRDLEQVIIAVLAEYNLRGERKEKFTGVWVNGAKVCAIGIKISRWVTMHGFAFNINTDLSYFKNIVPCGISDKPVTSLQVLLGREVDMQEIEQKIIVHFQQIFGIHFKEKRFDSLIEGSFAETTAEIS